MTPPLPDEWLTQWVLVGFAGVAGAPAGIYQCPACGGCCKSTVVPGAGCLACRANGRFSVRADGAVLTEQWSQQDGAFVLPALA